MGKNGDDVAPLNTATEGELGQTATSNDAPATRDKRQIEWTWRDSTRDRVLAHLESPTGAKGRRAGAGFVRGNAGRVSSL